VKVLDFGLVKDLKGDGPHVTQENSITGTPLYMSPEAIRSPASVDARSDLYGLGAVAYYLLVGDHVFRGASLIEVCSKHLHEIPQPPSARSGQPLPEALDRLVLDCLEKQPERRPQTARQFLERLARVNANPWERSQAEAWWREHGSMARASGLPATGTGKTIQVDLELGRSP